MVVPEQHLITSLILVTVPGGIQGRIKPVVFPNPVALDDFGCRSDGDLRAFEGVSPGLVRDVLDTPRIAGPLRTIAVAVFQETVLGPVIRVPFVCGAMPALDGRDVIVEGAIGGIGVNPKTGDHRQRDRGRGASLTAKITPAVVIG